MDSNLQVFIPMEDFPEEMVFQELQAFPYQAISNSFFLREQGSWAQLGCNRSWGWMDNFPITATQRRVFWQKEVIWGKQERERERLIQSFLAETWALLDFFSCPHQARYHHRSLVLRSLIKSTLSPGKKTERTMKSTGGQKHTSWWNGFGTVLPVSKPHAGYSRLPLIKEINVSVMGFRCCCSSYQEDFHSSSSWISSVEQRMPFLACLHFVLLLMQPKRGTRAMAFPSNLEQACIPERPTSGPKKVRLVLSAESS